MSLREKIKQASIASKIIVTLLIILGAIFVGGEFISIIKLRRENTALRQQIKHYTESYKRDSILIENLKSPEFLEQYARENYLMKADNEEVYIIR